MGHAERRRAIFPPAPPAAPAGETTLATRSWRARVAVGALLRELRVVGARGIAAPGTVASPGMLGRAWRRLGDAARAALRGFARGEPPELVVTADWRVPGGAADATVGRRRLGEQPLRRSSRDRCRPEVAARDVEALLGALGDVAPEELETALRVVRRVRALAGAA